MRANIPTAYHRCDRGERQRASTQNPKQDMPPAAKRTSHYRSGRSRADSFCTLIATRKFALLSAVTWLACCVVSCIMCGLVCPCGDAMHDGKTAQRMGTRFDSFCTPIHSLMPTPFASMRSACSMGSAATFLVWATARSARSVMVALPMLACSDAHAVMHALLTAMRRGASQTGYCRGVQWSSYVII